ncbi:MAG: metallophosphoesterase [Pirellulales bacterium]
MISSFRTSFQLGLIGFCLWLSATPLLLGQQIANPSSSTIQVHSLGDAKPKPWTSLNISRSERDFQFAVVSDNAGTPRPGIWREAMNKINLLQPAFVMSVGDLIEGYVDSADQLNKQWDGFLSDLAPLQLPFFFVAGNHDVGRPLWYDVYRQRIGPTWYYFIYQDVLFLILDTNDGPEHSTGISDQQIAWIEEVLKKVPLARFDGR